MTTNSNTIVIGLDTYALPAAPYRGIDSVLRLGPINHPAVSYDLAGGGALCGYAAWQSAPSGSLSQRLSITDIDGAGVASGYGRQPGELATAPTVGSGSTNM